MENFRSKIFKRAHQIQKETGKNFNICLMVSWKAHTLVQKMSKDNTVFAFEKKDGTLRYATGTLNMKQIPKQDRPKGLRPDHYKAIPFFDVELKAWRSFKTQSLIKVY